MENNEEKKNVDLEVRIPRKKLFNNISTIIVIFSEIIAASYAVMSIFGPFPMSVGIFLSLCAFLLFVNSILFYSMYRSWDVVGIRSRVAIVLWSAPVIWYWGLSPIFYILSMNFTQAQLKVIAFSYLWEVPLVGGIYIFIAVIMFRPFYCFLTNQKSRIKSPQDAYDFLDGYPFKAALALSFIVISGVIAGAFQQWYLAQLPFFEIVKVISHGAASSLLAGVYVFLFLNHIFNSFRKEIRKRYPGESFSTSGFITKTYGSAFMISIGSILLFLLMGVKVTQDIIRNVVVSYAEVNFGNVINCVDPEAKEENLKRQFGKNCEIFIFSKDSEVKEKLAPETVEYIESGVNGSIDDHRSEIKAVVFKTDPITKEKNVLVIYLKDYYNYLYTGIFYVLAAVFIIGIFITAMMVSFITATVNSLRRIINVISTKGEDVLDLKLYTGDEFENLADTVSRYARESKYHQGDLEKEVKEKTKELDKKIEEMENANNSLADTEKAMLNILEDARDYEIRLEKQTTELKKFSMAIESASEHVIITDPDGVILYVNPAAEYLTGYSKKEILGKRPSLWGGLMTKEFYGNMWDTIKNKKKTFAGEIKNKRKNGEVYITSVIISPILDEKGNIRFFIGLERDVTIEKKLTEELKIEKENIEKKVAERTADLAKAKNEVSRGWMQLQKEKARVVASITSLPLGFVMTDTQNNIVVSNPALEKIFNFTQDKWTLMDIAKQLGGSFDLVKNCQACLIEKKTIDVKDISYGSKFLRIFIAPITTAENEAIGTVILVEDITETKVLERSRDEFFSIASHELRTPLTSIKGNSSLIQEYYADKFKDDKQLTEMIDDIHESSVRLIGIVNDFLDLSRLEQKRVEFKKEVFDIVPLIERIVYELATTAKERKISVKFDQPSGVHPNILADSARTKQIIYNLLGNAIKFTDAGGVTVNIDIKNKFLNIRVTDTGKGIPIKSQSLLFRKFQQTENNILTRDNTQGTGLGLYISKLMATGMGGDVVLESSMENKGSTFLVTLPLAAEKDVDVQKEDKEKEAVQNEIKPATATGTKSDEIVVEKGEVKPEDKAEAEPEEKVETKQEEKPKEKVEEKPEV
jgi:PAS domain S-box-containing protein